MTEKKNHLLKKKRKTLEENKQTKYLRTLERKSKTLIIQ